MCYIPAFAAWAAIIAELTVSVTSGADDLLWRVEGNEVEATETAAVDTS